MMATQTPPLLQLIDVHAGYATSEVLAGVSLEVMDGEIVCLLGRNGAGKTTTIRTIAGLLVPTRGSIKIAGVESSRSAPMDIVAAGIAVVPEGRKVFKSLTVEENLYVGAYSRRSGLIPRASLDRVFELFPRMAERRKQLAGTLSGGEQQMLAMGRAMMAQPRLLLLDEPSMGLAPLLIDLIFETINQLAENGVTILLVEQNATAALDVSDRAYVLERGQIVLSGTSQALEQTEEVRHAYLGQ
ncbi:MAG: ABC transporter ATP-binding protein [Pseudomonadota bacterium]